MLLLLADLMLIANTVALTQLLDSLPVMLIWGFWTATLLACGLASLQSRYDRFHDKILGLCGVMMFYLSYPLLWSYYLAFIPTTPEDFGWGGIVLTLNVLVPLVLVSAGPATARVAFR